MEPDGKFILSKNRNGQTGIVEVTFNAKRTTFYEIDKVHRDSEESF